MTAARLRRLLMVVACILFILAALCFGGVIPGWSALAFLAGAFAVWALSGAVP